jgi:uncharacterized protein (TIRG00374 family)
MSGSVESERTKGQPEPPKPGEEVLGAQEPRFFEDPKKIAHTIIVVVLLVAAIYFLLPALVGVEDGIAELGRGDPLWVAIAISFSVTMFLSYVALFKGVVGERIRLRWRESYEITMAGLAATRLFSAGGAGGIVLTYWALRKAGMEQKQCACRMVAFLVLLYAVYMLALVLTGVLLRTGVLPGPAPAGLTVVPAAFGGAVIVIFLLFTLVPGDLERRFSSASQATFTGRTMRRLATVPSTLASGTRTAIAFIREPERGGLAVAGAVGFWASNIAILWASFEAFGVDVPIAVLVQGFFVGMLANLIPLPGGVGGVDAGMIGSFLLFDLPGVGESKVIAAVFLYRLIAFWMPLLPGVIAFFQLRRTVSRWERARPALAAPRGAEQGPLAPSQSITSESKV